VNKKVLTTSGRRVFRTLGWVCEFSQTLQSLQSVGDKRVGFVPGSGAWKGDRGIFDLRFLIFDWEAGGGNPKISLKKIATVIFAQCLLGE
jgi:hypothetical protein